MNKNGFIAMSLIYSFFIVFLIIIFSILSFYEESNNISDGLNEKIKRDYNSIGYCSNCSPRIQSYNKANVTDDKTFPIGSYVYLPLNNYDGLFLVYNNNVKKKLTFSGEANYTFSTVKLISEYPVAIGNDNTGKYIDLNNFVFSSNDVIEKIYPSYIKVTSGVADYILEDENFDNYVRKTGSMNPSDYQNFYNTLNSKGVYRLNYKDASNVIHSGMVITNCTCGSDTFEKYLYNGTTTITSNGINTLNAIAPFSSFCTNKTMTTNIMSCPIKFVETATMNYNYPIRLYVFLRDNTVITGGNGTINDPYLLGVDI